MNPINRGHCISKVTANGLCTIAMFFIPKVPHKDGLIRHIILHKAAYLLSQQKHIRISTLERNVLPLLPLCRKAAEHESDLGAQQRTRS